MPLKLSGSTGISGLDGSAGSPVYAGANANTGMYVSGSNVYIAVNGTQAVTVSNNGLALNIANTFTVANTVITNTGITVAGSYISQYSGMMKNRIINGDMRIDQRYAGASNTINSNAQYQYNLDRWYFLNYTGGVFTAQQMNSSNTSVSNYEANSAPTGFLNSTKLVVTTANSSPATTSFCRILQTIEGLNIADLDFGKSTAKPVTLSFWVKSSLTGSYTATILNALGNRVNPQQYTINVANTWEYKTITYTGSTDGTWWINNGQGLYVDFWLAGGSAYVTSSSGWNSTNGYEITGQANWLSTVGNTFYITGVQLEVGTVATPFEFRHYGTELALCQRYYYKLTGGARVFGTQAVTSYMNWFLPVVMRAAPTVTAGTSADYSGATSYADAFYFYKSGTYAVIGDGQQFSAEL